MEGVSAAAEGKTLSPSQQQRTMKKVQLIGGQTNNVPGESSSWPKIEKGSHHRPSDGGSEKNQTGNRKGAIEGVTTGKGRHGKQGRKWRN